MPKVIVNSTPIISLAHIGELVLLKKIYKSVYIPRAVFEEICIKRGSIAEIKLKESLSWIEVLDIKNEMTKMFYKSQLHDGEVEVMILGKEIDADLLIIDDKNAKKYAKYLGFNVTGTLGLFIKAKNLGYIDKVKPLIGKMTENGFYIDNRVIKMCLKECDED